MHIEKLDDVVNKYNNKMKPVDVKSSTYIEDPKFKVDDHVRTSRYKKKLQKAMFQIGLKKFL